MNPWALAIKRGFLKSCDVKQEDAGFPLAVWDEQFVLGWGSTPKEDLGSDDLMAMKKRAGSPDNSGLLSGALG